MYTYSSNIWICYKVIIFFKYPWFKVPVTVVICRLFYLWSCVCELTFLTVFLDISTYKWGIFFIVDRRKQSTNTYKLEPKIVAVVERSSLFRVKIVNVSSNSPIRDLKISGVGRHLTWCAIWHFCPKRSVKIKFL